MSTETTTWWIEAAPDPLPPVDLTPEPLPVRLPDGRQAVLTGSDLRLVPTGERDAAYWNQFRAPLPAPPPPRIDIAKRFREWVDAGRPGLEVDETAVCATGVKLGDDDPRIEDADENGWIECGKVSRFIVERSDFSDSYGELGGGCEACEEHVAEEVFLMLEGDDTLRAVVTPRWDAPGPDEKG